MFSSKALKWSLVALASLSSSLGWSQETSHETQPMSHLSSDSTVTASGHTNDSSSRWFSSEYGFFPHLKADPRQPRMSGDYRWADKRFRSTNTGAANIGGDVPIWSTRDLGYFDEFEVGLQAAVFGLFDMKSTNFQFINSDWYACIPVYARTGDTSWRLRLYHISSHLGDEWIIDNNLTSRGDPSYEIVDLTAYRPLWQDRLYGYATIGYIARHSPSWPMGNNYFSLGAEYYFKDSSFQTASLEAEPYAAMHGQCWEKNHYSLDLTTCVGISWRDRFNPGHQILTSLGYYRGHVLDGEFSKDRTHYIYFQFAFEP